MTRNAQRVASRHAEHVARALPCVAHPLSALFAPAAALASKQQQKQLSGREALGGLSHNPAGLKNASATQGAAAAAAAGGAPARPTSAHVAGPSALEGVGGTGATMVMSKSGRPVSATLLVRLGFGSGIGVGDEGRGWGWG